MQAKLTILGCGSALPTRLNFSSAQLLEMRNRQFLIDCGEGAQIRIRQMAISTARLGHVFISHLHGDHTFGLIGIISSLGMMDRTADLHIHAHRDLQKLLQPQLDYFCEHLNYSVYFHDINPQRHELIYEDRAVRVFSLPLKHCVPCCGFLFEEKVRDRHLIPEMIEAYQIPIAYRHKIKQGADFELPDGTIIPNERLTTPPDVPLRYAYCSDTAYNEKLIPLIEGVDCLYHEATFLNDKLVRAKETLHSTVEQAATIALRAQVKQLIIGHFSARYTDQSLILREAQSIFPNTVLGQDKTHYLIG